MCHAGRVTATAQRRRLILVACILGSAIVFLDGTVVNVALPRLRDDLGADLAEQQWIVESYLLTLGSLVLIGGSLGDLLGRRRVFAAGVAGFGVTSLLCAVAPDPTILIAFRAVQGIAGALLVPSTLAIITASFDGPARGAAIGSWTAWTSGAIAVGPPVGGFLVDAISWRVIFAMNVPLVLACLWLIARAVPHFAGQPGRHVDLPGAALCALGLGGPVFALIEQPDRGFGAPVVWVPLAGGLLLLGLFLLYEGRWSRDPMLPLGLFRSRNFAAGNAATFTIYAGLGAVSFFVSLFLQQVAGYDALEGGIALLPVTVMLVFLSRRWGQLSEKIGPRLFMTAGPVVAAIGMAMWLMLDERGDYLTGVLPGSVVFGLGMSMTVAPLTSTVLGAVDEQHAGVASGVNNAVARVAGLLAIAIVGAVVAASFSHALDDRLPTRLNAPARQTVDEARKTPLVPVDPKPRATQPRVLRAAEVDASVTAFHSGVLTSALLVLAGGLIALAGVRNPRRVEALPPAPRPAVAAAGGEGAGGDGSPASGALRSGILQGPCAPASASARRRTSTSPPSRSSP
jgi:EmrB/QacA subfamily drug resistance transporter